MSKWSNYFARCVKIRNYRIGSLKRELPCGSKSKLHQFQDYNLGGENVWKINVFYLLLAIYLYYLLYSCSQEQERRCSV